LRFLLVYPQRRLCSGNAGAFLSAGTFAKAESVRPTLHFRHWIMTHDARAAFDYFSDEYAQALQAFETIETQSSTLLMMGHHDELRAFLDQFIAMAERTRDEATEQNESNFADWFNELIAKARSMRSSVPR
jgi:hypothetical protein